MNFRTFESVFGLRHREVPPRLEAAVWASSERDKPLFSAQRRRAPARHAKDGKQTLGAPSAMADCGPKADMRAKVVATLAPDPAQPVHFISCTAGRRPKPWKSAVSESREGHRPSTRGHSPPPGTLTFLAAQIIQIIQGQHIHL